MDRIGGVGNLSAQGGSLLRAESGAQFVLMAVCGSWRRLDYLAGSKSPLGSCLPLGVFADARSQPVSGGVWRGSVPAALVPARRVGSGPGGARVAEQLGGCRADELRRWPPSHLSHTGGRR